jgi:hypothetical protein
MSLKRRSAGRRMARPPPWIPAARSRVRMAARRVRSRPADPPQEDGLRWEDTARGSGPSSTQRPPWSVVPPSPCITGCPRSASRASSEASCSTMPSATRFVCVPLLLCGRCGQRATRWTLAGGARVRPGLAVRAGSAGQHGRRTSARAHGRRGLRLQLGVDRWSVRLGARTGVVLSGSL